MEDKIKTLKTLQTVGIAEGVSYILIFVTMIFKYKMDILWPNKVVGYAHGFLTVLFFILTLKTTLQLKWGLKNFALSIIASLLPFGTFIADAKIFKPELKKLQHPSK